MRKISRGMVDGHPCMLLNNKPLYQFGVLDQGWWPDGLLTPPSDEGMRYDIEVVQSLGMNMIRKHIKVEPARWYYYCDKMGMLVWPSWFSYLSRSWQPGKYKRWFLRSLQETFDARLYPYGWDTPDFIQNTDWVKALVASDDGRYPSVCKGSRNMPGRYSGIKTCRRYVGGVFL